MLKILFFTLASFGSDSVRTEVINGKTYIIHKVEAKETLFSISRKYGVALLGVVESNPGADSGLEIGQEIKVPYSANNRSKTKEGTIHRVGDKETLYSIAKQYGVSVDDIKKWNNLNNAGLKLGQELLIKEKVKGNDKEAALDEPKGQVKHEVAAGETMYSISRAYKVSVEQLKEWNKLSGNELKPGQVILVSSPLRDKGISKETSPTVNDEVKITKPKEQTVTATSTTSVNNNTSSTQTPIPVTPAVVGTDEARESGMAALLDGTEGNRRYLAHHRTVRPGTIIRVKNNLTHKEVFVRVIGNLPNTESPDVLLRLSKSAFDKLGGDGKFAVEVTYFK